MVALRTTRVPCPDLAPSCRSGDSITLGTGSSDGAAIASSYQAGRCQLTVGSLFVGTLDLRSHNRRGKAFPRSHEGHSGFVIDTITNARPLVGHRCGDRQFHSHTSVLLMIGTNDIVWKVPARLGNLIDKILADAPKPWWSWPSDWSQHDAARTRHS